nr:aspartic proteinase-like protein 2 [Tanacetum cinerariifolium]
VFFTNRRSLLCDFILDYSVLIRQLKQSTSLKPYVPNVILKKIIIDLEDEVVNLLEKEKANLETIESLKSKGFESSENVSSKSENQTKNDCLVVEKKCDKEKNSKVIAPGMFKLNVSQYLDTFSSVRRPKNSDVIWKKKRLSNTSNVSLSAVSVLNLHKNVKRYSRKDLLACNNSHLGETSSAYMCNDAMNVSCDPRMNDLLDDNNLFIFDGVNVRISPVSKMPFRKKPRNSMHMRSKSNSNKSLSRTVHKWLPKLQPARYNVELKAIEVRGDVLQLPTDIFDVGEKRGTIIDSGTTLVYLPDLVYKQVLEKQFTCYKYFGNVDRGFLDVIFHFENSLSLKVRPSQHLFEVADQDWCVHFQDSDLQSQGKEITLLGGEPRVLFLYFFYS